MEIKVFGSILLQTGNTGPPSAVGVWDTITRLLSMAELGWVPSSERENRFWWYCPVSPTVTFAIPLQMTKRLSMKSSSTRIHQPPPETRFRTYQLDMFQVSSFTSNSKGSTRQPLDFHRRFRRPAEMRNGMHKSWSHENFERSTCITGGHRAVK